METLSNEALMYHTPGLAIWKDLELKYLGANKKILDMFGFNTLDTIMGKSVFDIPCKAVECASDFLVQDEAVCREKTTLEVLDIHPFAQNEVRILLGKREIIYEEKQAVGTFYSGIELSSKALSSLVYSMTQQDKFYYPENNQRNYNLNNLDNNIKLTTKESEILFFILRGYTPKHIAQVLSRSVRTIEKHIENIKNKHSCSSKAQLIEKACYLGFMSYLPKSLITKNVSLILS